MPTYDYKCKACDHAFEAFQSMTAKPLRKCPECGKSTLERLIGTGAAILFKGSGFYQTDYRSESYKKAAEADKKDTSASPETKSDKKAGTKAEKKPEKKTEPKPKGTKGPGSKSAA